MNTRKILTYAYYAWAAIINMGVIYLLLDNDLDIYSFLGWLVINTGVYLIATQK